jgi:hypothetical protein
LFGVHVKMPTVQNRDADAAAAAADAAAAAADCEAEDADDRAALMPQVASGLRLYVWHEGEELK